MQIDDLLDCSDEYSDMNRRVMAIERRLGMSNAMSVSANAALDNGSSVVSTDNRDLLIIALVVFNIGTILGCISCLVWNKKVGAKGYVYDGVQAVVNDDME